MIRDIYHNGNDSVHNKRVEKINTKFYSEKTQYKCLQEVTKAKKKMYLEAYLQQHRHFRPKQ